MMKDDIDLAERLATEAGKLLLDLRIAGEFEGRALGDAGDKAANAFLMEELRRLRPDDGILSEESKDTHERLSKERVWIIDPVDGTREYGEGRSDWAVHVGLSIGGVAAGGTVALPALDGGLTLRSDKRLTFSSHQGAPRIVVSRSRPPAEATKLVNGMGAKLVPMGSAGAKAMAVVRGKAEIYVHSGGQYEWDSCAPIAVANGHGFHCSRIDGSPLLYNREDTYLPDLLICRSDLASEALRIIAAD